MPILERLKSDLEKGIHGVGLRAQINPNMLIEAGEILAQGTSEQITHMFRLIGGEAFSLAVGHSTMGEPALDAMGLAQSMSLVAERNAMSSPLDPHNLAGIVSLLTKHSDMLVNWVKTGFDTRGGSESDLSQIGLLIEVPEMRLAAAAFYIAVVQVLASTFSLFIQTSQATPLAKTTVH